MMNLKFSVVLAMMIAVFAFLRLMDGVDANDVMSVIVLTGFAILARWMSGVTDVRALVSWGQVNWKQAAIWVILMLLQVGLATWGLYQGKLNAGRAGFLLIQGAIIFGTFLIAGVWLKGIFLSLVSKFRRKQ